MKQIRLLFSLLTITGRFSLLFLVLRQRIRPVWPTIRSTYQMRKELRQLSQEFRFFAKAFRR